VRELRLGVVRNVGVYLLPVVFCHRGSLAVAANRQQPLQQIDVGEREFEFLHRAASSACSRRMRSPAFMRACNSARSNGLTT